MTPQKVVDHQANMESLWLLNPTINEHLLISALRHLHAVIEKDPVAAEIYKNEYWNLEEEQ